MTSGGVSVGRHDLVRAALASLGGDEVFWRVAVKPGKPISFGVRGSTLVFGLPGNPVSALVGFELFVRPAAARAAGLVAAGAALAARVAWGAASGAIGNATSWSARAVATARTALVLDPVSGQDSHMIVRAAGADALVLVERGDGEQRGWIGGPLPGADVVVGGAPSLPVSPPSRDARTDARTSPRTGPRSGGPGTRDGAA